MPTNVGSTAVVTVAGAIGLADTRGYTAPEYTDGKRGTKTDVFSYGVVSVSVLFTTLCFIMLSVGLSRDVHRTVALLRGAG